MKYISFLALFIFMSCASYTVTKESLVEQLQKDQNITQARNIASIGTAYSSNSLSKIKCFDKNGKEVSINADKNTTFAITNLSGKTCTFYYDTVYLSHDSLVGLKSRILGEKRTIALNDILSIQVKTEN